VPTASTLQNYDSDRDSDARLWLVQSSLGLSETDTTMTQLCQQTIASPVDLKGTVTIHVTAAMTAFNTTHAGTAEAWLLDCNGAGTSCTTPWALVCLPGHAGTPRPPGTTRPSISER